MSKQNNRMTAFFPALGLAFGTGVGLLLATLTSWNMATVMIIGAALGLTAGLILNGFSKKSGK